MVGIGGLIGAGRTELLRLIYGLDNPATGEVSVDGKRLAPGRTSAAIGAGLGLAPEDRKSQGLLLGWNLTKNVSLADLRRFLRGPLINGRSEREAARDQLRAINTKPDDPTGSHASSRAATSRRSCSRAGCMHECRVLLLDEPTRGVDVGAKQEIYRLIAELAKTGIAVVMVSSETEELLGLSSRILVMREGTVVAELDGATATEVELLSHAVAHTDTITTPGGGNVSSAPAAPRRFPALPFGGGRIELQEYALVGVVVLLLVVGAILEPDSFLTKDNMLNVLRQASIVGVVAIGMTFVIATAGTTSRSGPWSPRRVSRAASSPIPAA